MAGADPKKRKRPLDFSRGLCRLMHLLEQRVERISAESGCGSYTHVDSEFVLLDPQANSGHVVLVQECHVVGLERMVQVTRP